MTEPVAPTPDDDNVELVQQASAQPLLCVDDEHEVIEPTEILHSEPGPQPSVEGVLELSDQDSVQCSPMSETESSDYECSKLYNCRVVLRDAANELFCERCNIWSVSVAKLALHKQTHSPAGAVKQKHQQRFSCDRCPKRFAYRGSLIQHKLDHCEEKQHHLSRKISTTQSHWSRPNAAGQKRFKKFTCNQCSESFTHKLKLTQHKHYVHSQEKTYSCDECGKCFIHKRNLARHKDVHNGANLFSCDECNKRFTQKVTLRRHKEIHRRNNPEAQNDQCDQLDFQESQSIQHQQNYHSKEKQFSCDHCDMRFSQKKNLLMHKEFHKKSFDCDQWKSHLIQNKLSHTNDSPSHFTEKQNLVQNKVEKHLDQQASLVPHEHVHNSPEKPCVTQDQCDQLLGQKLHSNSTGHSIQNGKKPSARNQDILGGEKSFKCDQCDQHFTRKTDLVQHKDIHDKEKPLAHDQSDQKMHLSQNKNNLNSRKKDKSATQKAESPEHKEIHNGKKQIPDQCEESFTQKAELPQQNEIHSIEKTFACDQCDRKYSYFRNLLKHKKRHCTQKTSVPNQSVHLDSIVSENKAHSDGKLFAWDQCEEDFTHKALDRHKDILNGEDLLCPEGECERVISFSMY